MLASLPSLLVRPAQQCRALCAAAAAAAEVWATSINCKGGKTLELEFNTGERFTLPAEYLRVESPAAGNRDSTDAAGRLKIVHGRRHIGIMGIEPVGSYAIRLDFDDLHSHGIYSWQYLHDLGTQKWPRMRRYLKELHQQRLSRDPPALGRRRKLPPLEQSGSSGGGGSKSGGDAQSSGGGSGCGSHSGSSCGSHHSSGDAQPG